MTRPNQKLGRSSQGDALLVDWRSHTQREWYLGFAEATLAKAIPIGMKSGIPVYLALSAKAQ